MLFNPSDVLHEIYTNIERLSYKRSTDQETWSYSWEYACIIVFKKQIYCSHYQFLLSVPSSIVIVVSNGDIRATLVTFGFSNAMFEYYM